MLSSYTLNTFKDHDDNLIFILVDAIVEINVKESKKKQQNTSFKTAQIKPAFDTVFS